MRLYGKMWGVAGGSRETQCYSVRDCCWRLASQRQGWSASCDDVNLSEDELDFQVLKHTPTSLLIFRILVGVMRVGALAILAAVTVCQLQYAVYCN